ncbi:MAG: cyclic nucleotide-binding domain-containing protein [Myxococcales bacterium]|nr:cyclic nucleotide-binding domain-containing protein [Myxococcales bacterium]
MKALLLRFFGLGPEDQRTLVLLGPLFALATASSVIVATFTKALFLSANEQSAMPWMFLGTSGFTAIASVAYVMLMERLSMHRRFTALLLCAVLSFSALRLAYPLNEQLMSFVLLVWCTGIGHLILIQMWNLSSGLLPARQGKRLFPVFAAISTLGAAAGGGLVQTVLALDVPTQDLVWVSVVLLAVPLVRVRKIISELAGAMPTAGIEGDVRRSRKGGRKIQRIKGGSEVVRGARSLLESPLLKRLAIFVFLMQIASVLVDYTFSVELKTTFSKHELANFFGKYYGLSNLTAFGFALFASSRMVRVVGIGLAVASSAGVIAIGSAVYLAANLGFAVGSAFWAIIACSFFERIISFALSRNAMQMLVTPIETRKGERAKTLIDGVVYRLATILVSIALLIVQPSVAQLWWLAPFAIAASVAVVFVALGIGPHYRRTLFEALRSRTLDTSADPQLQAWVAKTALAEISERLASPDPGNVLKALDLLRDLRIPLKAKRLTPLLANDHPDVVRRTLETMTRLNVQPPKETLLNLLRLDQDDGVLREVLRMLDAVDDDGLVPRVRSYAGHPDPGVASLAIIWLKRVAGYKSTMDIQTDLMSDIYSDDDMRRARAAKMAGRTQWREATRDLPKMIDDHSVAVRRNAVEAMGQVGLTAYIDPLIRCLGRADVGDRARVALMRFGPDLIAQVAARIESGALNLAAQIRVLGVVEGIAGRTAVDLLMACAESSEPAIKNQAVASLWRMARDPGRPRPPTDWVRDRVVGELDLLERFATVTSLVERASIRRTFFLDEVASLRVQTEARTFRLLGLMLPRAAMYRAYVNYRSTSRRVRSNAIELLDQHVRDPALRPFVALVERGLDQEGVFARSGVLDDVDAAVATSLRSGGAWLSRLWAWTLATDATSSLTLSSEGVADVAQDPMDMVFLLKSVPLFAGLSGEQLLPLAEIVSHVTFERGDVVFEQGQPGSHVYLILEGEVEVINDGERVARLGVKECFGEMALLDQGARSASIRCLKDCDLWAISRDDFQDLLDLHPALAKGVIRVLTARLRDATDQQSDANKAAAVA